MQVRGALGLQPQSAEELARAAGAGDNVELVYLLLEHLAANGRARSTGDGTPDGARFWKVS
jgi:glucose-6-phosphate isomerase